MELRYALMDPPLGFETGFHLPARGLSSPESPIADGESRTKTAEFPALHAFGRRSRPADAVRSDVPRRPGSG